MTSDSPTQAKLRACLAALTHSQAAQLLAACEDAEARGAPTTIPIDMVRQAVAERRETFIARAFGAAAPLVRDTSGPKRPGQIARASLGAIAAFVEEIAPDAYAAMVDGEKGVYVLRETLGHALRTEMRRDKRGERRRTLGERAYEDVCDITALLCAEPELSQGLSTFPKRIADLNADQMRRLQELWVKVSAKDRAVSPILFFLILARLQKRVQILRLLKRVAGPGRDIMVAETDVGAIGDLLLEEAEAAIATMARPLQPASHPDGAAVVEAMAVFAEISRSMTRDLGLRRDGKWGKWLQDLRVRAATVMEAVCNAASKEIDEALPLTRMSLNGGVPTFRPAVANPPCEPLYARGLAFAAIVGGVGKQASFCGFGAAYAKALVDAERIVDAYCDGLLELIQYSDAATLRAVEPWRVLAERFVRALLGERAVQVFVRRVAAARGARVQAGAA